MSEADRPIHDLIEEIRADREIASELLRKFPNLISTNGDVTFNLGDPVVVPSIPKLREELLAGNTLERVGDVETLSRGLVQEISRLAAALDESQRQSPFFDILDLTSANSDGATGEALYRAEVDQAIRLPYDAIQVVQVDRKFAGNASRIGDWMLPNYAVAPIQTYSTAPSSANVQNVGFSSETSTVTRTVRRSRTVYRSYYGYYYRWYWYRYRYLRRYYYSTTYYYAYSYTETVESTQKVQAQVQTHVFSQDRVVTGFKMHVNNPAGTKGAANPRIVIYGTAYGMPDPDNVLSAGTYVDDAAYAGSGVQQLTVQLDRPFVARANQPFSIAMHVDGDWYVCYSENENGDGNLFETEDGFFYRRASDRDLCVDILTADFGENANEITIPIPDMQVSGGIASIREDLAMDLPSGSAASVQFELDGTWHDLAYMDEVQSLPPYMPMRLKVIGSRYACPLVDTTRSTATGLRPAVAGRYITKPQETAITVKIAYELVGYDELLQSFDPALKESGQRYLPDILEEAVSADGTVRSITATYTLPGAAPYSHDIQYGTQTAAKTFDINSVIRL